MRQQDRVPTGIPGLDDLIEGGFVPGSAILVTGEAGSGKTILGTQFLWNALCLGENGVYITLQQTPDDIINDAAPFVGKDFDFAIKHKQCKIVFVPFQDIKKLYEIIVSSVQEINAKRLVIDSITMFCEAASNMFEMRHMLNKLIIDLKKLGVTTIMISEIPEGSNRISRYGIEEFMADGVIVLNAGVEIVGGKPRSLYIKKMRRTKHDMNLHPIEITEKGMRVLK